jgi:thiamine pyrophosphate-dependent acetolactate synthase large subunit-like protein
MEKSGASIIIYHLARKQSQYVFLVLGKSIAPLVRAIAPSSLQEILATSKLSTGDMAGGFTLQ